VADLIYIALGAGVQSTALLIGSVDGRFPHADVAIFADTGEEPAYVYEHLARLRKWSSIPIETVRRKQRKAFRVVIPAYTDRGGRKGMLQRQCTNNWKLEPILAHVRKLLGAKPRGRVKGTATAMLGISVDEAHRMKPGPKPYITNCYPLVDARLRREDCEKIIRAVGLTPERSACYFCPFHSDAEWRRLRDRHPDEWARAIRYDAEIRDSSREGARSPLFLHRDCVPLGQVKLDRPDTPLFPDAFGNECEGLCGV
jgi:hypothetical protein